MRFWDRAQLGQFGSPLPALLGRTQWRLDRERPTRPPYYVSFFGPKTNGVTKRGGPFLTIDEAFQYAAEHGGYKAAPLDGGVQVCDSVGNPAGPAI